MIGIYKITNPEGLVYIGRSKNIIGRFTSHRCGNNPPSKLSESFLKYGFERHKLEIIYECKEDDLKGSEVFFIKKYNSVNNGLNTSHGWNTYFDKSKNDPVEISIIYNSRKERRILLTDEEFTNVRLFLKSIRNNK